MLLKPIREILATEIYRWWLLFFFNVLFCIEIPKEYIYATDASRNNGSNAIIKCKQCQTCSKLTAAHSSVSESSRVSVIVNSKLTMVY